jgi:hypothetical protein
MTLPPTFFVGGSICCDRRFGKRNLGHRSVCATNLPRQVSATNSDHKGVIERPATDLDRLHVAPTVPQSELPRGSLCGMKFI